MLEFIGDEDPELRDLLIYTAFSKWICTHNYFSNDELATLLKLALDDNRLFLSLGNVEDCTVLTRSFSTLLIALLLNKHIAIPVFNDIGRGKPNA